MANSINLPLSGAVTQAINPWELWIKSVSSKMFSPTINFGCNVEDADVEQHVVDEVGSYGKQLNRVLDVLTVLVARIDEKELKLTPQERQFVDQFEELARAADDAVTKFKGKHRRGITLDDINHMIEDLHSLAGKSPTGYRDFLERLYTAHPLPEKTAHPLPEK